MSLLGSSILIGAIATTSSSSSGGGVTAHSALTGLTTGNDHTQYLLKAGGTMTGALVTSAGTAALPAVAVAQSNLGLFQAATNTLGFATAGNERMRITSAGNVLIGTTTDLASSILTMGSTTKGFLPPRMTGTQRDAISSPATGLVVYNTTTDKLNFYNGSAWEAVTSA